MEAHAAAKAAFLATDMACLKACPDTNLFPDTNLLFNLIHIFNLIRIRASL